MAADGKFYQRGFAGGMNQLVEPWDLADNEYVYAHNVRNRRNSLVPVKTHVEVSAPAGVKQGLYVFGDYLVLFVAGSAYYRELAVNTWTQIADFAMDAETDRIYCCAVPASTMNFQRKAISASDTQSGANINSGVTYNGAEAGLVVQDGTSQPWLIYVDAGGLSARVTKTYSEWTNTDSTSDTREYVPVGSLMLFFDGVLYVVNRSKIYRSITGRPLDFVVNIDTSGNKGGDADSIAYSLSNADITAIHQLNTESFFVSTLDGNCYAVTPTRTVTIFGEPTFIRTYLFAASCINQFSFVDILGDFGFIDPEGLRSFNAVLQQQNEGRNSVFSAQVGRAFERIRQDTRWCAAVVFDNYAIFSVRTAYGNNFVVYDTLYRKFVSFDHSAFGWTKQFAAVSTNVKRLFAITDADKLIECYGGTTYAPATVRTRAWLVDDNGVEVKTESLRATFKKGLTGGEATASIFVDGAKRPATDGRNITRDLPDGDSGLLYSVNYPATWQYKRRLTNITFAFGGGVGSTVEYLITWSGDSVLTRFTSYNSLIGVKAAQSHQVTQ